MRRKIQITAWTLIWSGVLIGGYLAWQLVGTDWLNRRTQADAATALEETIDDAEVVEEEFDSDEVAGDVELPPGIPDTVTLFTEPEAVHGEPVARIRIPAIGVEAVIFSGTERPILNKGPGHMPRTPLPGQPGNSVVAGHRTTYGRPFHNVDLLEPGSEITLYTPIGSCTYEVNQEPFVVYPHQTEVVANTPDEATLTLTTCHPKHSARQRLIVKATLVRSDLATDAGTAA